MSKAVEEMNKKIAKLIKESNEEDIVGIISDERSIVRAAHVNHINNNREAGESE